MKTLTIVLMAGILFITGCTDESNIFAPQNSQVSGPNWITLPAPQYGTASVETEYSVTENIDGTIGGKLQINDIYFGGPHNTVKINVKLTFPKNCFTGTQNITMIVDNVNGTITYSPSMNFDIPALLDLQFQGLDLAGIDPDSINFVYHNPDGDFDSMEYDRLTVNMVNGTISMKDGKIPHFSRYGFSR